MAKSDEMKRLEAAMASDKELNEKFYKAVDRIAGEKTAQSDGELFAKAAQELGFNVTAADFEKLDAEKEEVSSDELEKVAGGVSIDKAVEDWCWRDYTCYLSYVLDSKYTDENDHNIACVTAWHCFAVTLHTDTNDDHSACWKDHVCISAYADKLVDDIIK